MVKWDNVFISIPSSGVVYKDAFCIEYRLGEKEFELFDYIDEIEVEYWSTIMWMWRTKYFDTTQEAVQFVEEYINEGL